MSRLTRKLLVNRALGLAAGEDYVNWAVSMLQAGEDTLNLRILAGLSKPLYRPVPRSLRVPPFLRVSVVL
jgi:hypothetical protein